MALTKTNFYLGVIILVVIVFSGMGIVGTAILNNDRINVNERSVDYIAQMKGVSSDSGYDEITEKESGSTGSLGVLDSGENSSVSDQADFLATFNIKKERASQPTNFLKIAYNVPTTIILGLGLPLADWKPYINAIVWLLFISIVILIFTKIVSI